MSCCGKEICGGCFYAPVYDHHGNAVDTQKCSFYRVPCPTTDEEIRRREKKRVELGDPRAVFNLGCDYMNGTNGYRQDYQGIRTLSSGSSIGYVYDEGKGRGVNILLKVQFRCLGISNCQYE